MSNTVSRDIERNNTVSFAGSYGQVIQRDAWFYGFSGEYSRRFKNLPLGFAGSIMWDKESEQNKKAVSTFTAALTSSYLISNHFSLGAGIGKGFIDNDNENQSHKFNDGDWATGIFLGYVLPIKSQFIFSISASYEYNISQKENSISFDFAVSLPY